MVMKYDAGTLADIHGEPVWTLASRVDCRVDTDAAQAFLASVRDAIVGLTDEISADDWEREVVEDYSGSRHEIADNAPDVYTWTLWQEFIGTAAYTWDDDARDLECENAGTSMEDRARLRLYLIADALAVSIANDILESLSDDGSNDV